MFPVMYINFRTYCPYGFRISKHSQNSSERVIQICTNDSEFALVSITVYWRDFIVERSLCGTELFSINTDVHAFVVINKPWRNSISGVQTHEYN